MGSRMLKAAVAMAMSLTLPACASKARPGVAPAVTTSPIGSASVASHVAKGFSDVLKDLEGHGICATPKEAKSLAISDPTAAAALDREAFCHDSTGAFSGILLSFTTAVGRDAAKGQLPQGVYGRGDNLWIADFSSSSSVQSSSVVNAVGSAYVQDGTTSTDVGATASGTPNVPPQTSAATSVSTGQGQANVHVKGPGMDGVINTVTRCKDNEGTLGEIFGEGSTSRGWLGLSAGTNIPDKDAGDGVVASLTSNPLGIWWTNSTVTGSMTLTPRSVRFDNFTLEVNTPGDWQTSEVVLNGTMTCP